MHCYHGYLLERHPSFIIRTWVKNLERKTKQRKATPHRIGIQAGRTRFTPFVFALLVRAVSFFVSSYTNSTGSLHSSRYELALLQQAAFTRLISRLKNEARDEPIGQSFAMYTIVSPNGFRPEC